MGFFKMRLFLPLPLALLLCLCVVPGVLGHTWIEQMRAIDDQGKYVGEYGYPRGFKSKNEPGYNGDKDMVYLLPPLEQQPPFINAENLLCHQNQRKPVQADKYPRLQATPGSWLALRYAENGHVSNPSTERGHVPGELDAGRRENGGSIFVFGTTEPKEDEKIAEVLRWTKDGQGGDKRGVLLNVMDYDDKRCYEINPVTQNGQRQKEFPNYAEGQAVDGAPGNFPLYCESNVELPKDAPSGKPYTLYWVWQWPMEPGKNQEFFPNGKDEYYTTCMDVDVVDAMQQSSDLQFALQPQDAMSEAVKDYRSRTALITDPIAGEVGPVFSSDGNGGGSATPTAAPAPTGGAPQDSSKPTAAPTPTGDAPPNSSKPAAAPTPTGDAPKNSQQPQPPAATSEAPSATKTTLATSASAPASQNTEIPTLTQRPGEKPAASSAPSDDGVVRITVTEKITVTASTASVAAPTGASPSAASPSKRAEHVARHNIRGRGFFGA